MEKLELPRVPRLPGPFSVRPPGSKSIANRALPLAALAKGPTRLSQLPGGEDVLLMQKALRDLGISVTPTKGTGGEPAVMVAGQDLFRGLDGEIDLHLGNSGTATRILTALLSAGEGTFRIDGIPRMRERPIGDLVDALRPLCGETRIIYEGKEGFPPLKIEAKGLAGGRTRIRGNLSSQFVTGVLMAIPLCKGQVEVEIEGTLVSAPYVDLTLQVMKTFGAVVEREDFKRFWMDKPSGYSYPGIFPIEPDASSASYFLAAGAITGDPVKVKGIGKVSLQGEARFASKLDENEMGAKVKYRGKSIIVSREGRLRGIDADMDLMSDTGMTLAVTALFAEPTPDNPTARTVIRNVGNWRLKETDRLRAMATELRKLGATVEEGEDWISIVPPEHLIPNAEIDTYDDHRMAMCFSLVCLGPRGVPVTIRDPGCVRKTYPGYWDEFNRMAGL